VSLLLAGLLARLLLAGLTWTIRVVVRHNASFSVEGERKRQITTLVRSENYHLTLEFFVVRPEQYGFRVSNSDTNFGRQEKGRRVVRALLSLAARRIGDSPLLPIKETRR
jgi:hypothetical protein